MEYRGSACLGRAEAVQRCKCGGAACKSAKVRRKSGVGIGVGDNIEVSGLPCLQVGLTILGRPRSSRDARPYPGLRPEEVSHFCTFAQAAGRFALLHIRRLGEPSLPIAF